MKQSGLKSRVVNQQPTRQTTRVAVGSRESKNSGLDHWTELPDWVEGHKDPAGFVVRVMEPKFKFFGFMSRVPKQSSESR